MRLKTRFLIIFTFLSSFTFLIGSGRFVGQGKENLYLLSTYDVPGAFDFITLLNTDSTMGWLYIVPIL